MKKLLIIMLAIGLCFSLVACGSSDSHAGEAKTPSGSSIQKGRDYQDVVADFEKKGFTNIQLNPLNDLITGWLTKDGEVESVSVDGDEGYSSDKWYPADVEVVITYHTFSPEESEESSEVADEEKETIEKDTTEGITNIEDETDSVLTVDNCEALAYIFSIIGDMDDAYSDFSETYRSCTIEFDGSIDYKENHTTYNSLTGNMSTSEYMWDILVSYGNFNMDSQIGPTIKFESVYGIGLADTGVNVHIIARVGSYNNDTGIFTMYLESIEER